MLTNACSTWTIGIYEKKARIFGHYNAYFCSKISMHFFPILLCHYLQTDMFSRFINYLSKQKTDFSISPVCILKIQTFEWVYMRLMSIQIVLDYEKIDNNNNLHAKYPNTTNEKNVPLLKSVNFSIVWQFGLILLTCINFQEICSIYQSLCKCKVCPFHANCAQM